MGLQGLAGDAFRIAQAGLHRHDLRPNHHLRIDFAERHPQEIEDPDARPGRLRLDPVPEVANEYRQDDQAEDQDRGDNRKRDKLACLFRRHKFFSAKLGEWGFGIKGFRVTSSDAVLLQ